MNQCINTTPSGLTTLSGLFSVLLVGALGSAQSQTYTLNADFDLGVLVQVNHTPPNGDQLQLNSDEPFSVLSVACGGLNTLVRINTVTGEVLGEYRTVPGTMAGDPSRATSVSNGDVWVGNRLEDGDSKTVFGSISKHGLIYGGTRVDVDGTPNSAGLYLQGPFDCNTCVDRDGDGLIRTSRGLGDVLSWPDVTDGLGGANGLVEDAIDECALIFQRTNPQRIRHLAIDSSNNVWAGGYPTFPTSFDEIDGATGAILSNTSANPPGCGGYAGVFDSAGVMWSTSELEGSLFRLDTGGTAICVNVQANVRGVAVAPDGFIWTAGGNRLVRVSPDGMQTQTFVIPGASQLHGVFIDSLSGEIWVASSVTGTVIRLDSGANVLSTISAGSQPRGLAMDNAGKIWVANQGSDNVMRIDPATNMVDMTVALSAGAAPYNPSDMTGTKVVVPDSDTGSWTVIKDGGLEGTLWNDVSWNEILPRGAALAVQVRASETLMGLDGLPFVSVGNAIGIAEFGRYIEIQANFTRSASNQLSPILLDLSIVGENVIEPGDCVMANRRAAGSLLVFPEFDNLSGNATVLTLTNTAEGQEGNLAVEFVYIDGDDCTEFNRTEYLTANDTLTVVTAQHNPNQELGFVYAFAKDAVSGEPIVANSLIGEVFVISAYMDCFECEEGVNTYSGIEYSVNAVAFQAPGQSGELTDINMDGLRNLDGVEYAMAPDAILIPRFFGQSSQADASSQGAPIVDQLILISLTGGSEFDTTLDFLIYNDNEEGFSAEHTFRCWEKRPLSSISDVFGQQFLADNTNHDPAEAIGPGMIETGWMRIDGAVANSVATSIHDPAFLAVLVESIGNFGGADLPFEECSQPGGVLLPRGVLGGN
ncbi:MAG: hypothetical protein ACI8X5_002705 [Planctomycetota bacterium]|jgi:hypothetical protein